MCVCVCVIVSERSLCDTISLRGCPPVGNTLNKSFYLSIRLSVCLTVGLCVYLSVCLSICLFVAVARCISKETMIRVLFKRHKAFCQMTAPCSQRHALFERGVAD